MDNPLISGHGRFRHCPAAGHNKHDQNQPKQPAIQNLFRPDWCATHQRD
jgi:hypothetical protein